MFEKQKRQFNPTITKLIGIYGDEIINTITVYRKPIQSYINTVLNTLSFGRFNKNLKETNYDKLFHLYMIVTIGEYNWFIVEKNERINIAKIKTIDNKIENRPVNLNNQKLSLNMLFNNTIKEIGIDNFFIYKSHSWNCQNFIYNILKSNNLLNDDLNTFILQDTEKIFNKLGYLKTFSDTLTNTAANIDIIARGGKLSNNEDYIIQSIMFNNYSLNDAINICMNNNIKPNKIKHNINKITILQYTIKSLNNKGYNNYKIYKIDNNIKLKIALKN